MERSRRPDKLRRLVALPLLALAASALASCSGSSPVSGGADAGRAGGFVPGTGMITSVPAKDRGKPLDLAGTDLDGKPLSLARYRGKVLVINIWGSWCGGCRAEADDLEAVATAAKAKGVAFVGIDTRDLQLAQPRAFVTAHHLTYPSLYDASGDLLLKFPKGIFNPQFIPSTLVLDRDGRLASRSLKALTAEQLDQMLAPVLAEKS